jgi:crotonobetainyl-CoA:carnitine CoA-transferase CaiB-like acyl-CoA transferase
MHPLDGIQVIDLSRLAPGPYCSMVLGDLGAEVLLVEAPPGATSNANRPTSVKDEARLNAFNALRRNKRSIVINLKEERGQAILHRLAERADILLEGFRPGVMQRLGADYETLSRLNPRLIYCSVSGYGQNGPYAQRVGHDINYLAVAGLLAAIGTPDKPAIPLNIVADFAGGGLMAAMAILAALVARGKSGRGQYIDIAMSDGVLYLMAMAVSRVLAGEAAPVPHNNYLNGMLPQFDTYRCKDGKFISLGSLETKFWKTLCRAMECEQHSGRPFDPAIFDEVREHFRRRFLTKTRDEWMRILGDQELCVAPVLRLDEALEDSHNRARHMVEELPHPVYGTVRQVGIGPKFSATPGAIRSPSPSPGQHSADVLTELGYAKDDITALFDDGVVG